MDNSIDQQFIEFIVKSLVGYPDDVSLARTIDEKGVLLELTVNPEDLGRVIGKRGATAQSLRTLLRALGTKNDARYNLKIIDNGEAPVRRQADDVATDSNDTERQDTPVKNNEPVEAETTIEEDNHNDVVSKTRKELEELDDLDI
ncbi:MAG: KH domain-containing protein [Candidatus Saccharimonadales bacterium]